jgi:hypothetical protein
MNRNHWWCGRPRLAGVAGLLVGVAGCGAAPGNLDGTEVAETAEAITDGILLPEGVGAPDTSAVALGTPNGSSLPLHRCSGTKIGSRRFLTAAHCNFQAGTQVVVSNSLDRSGGTTVDITSVATHATFLLSNLDHDVAIFDVSQSTPSIPTYNAFRPSWVATNNLGALTAYGCDKKPSDPNDYKGRYGFFTTVSSSNGVSDITIISGAHPPSLCRGDSGGPFFVKRNGIWEIAAVASRLDILTSSFARVSSVYAWLKDPRINVLASGRKGFLLHRPSNKPLAVASDTDPRPSIEIWDGRAHSTGSDFQYWELALGTHANTFQIRNTKSGTCLQTPTSSGTPIMMNLNCATAEERTWEFVNLSDNFYQIRNKQTGLCLSVASTVGAEAMGAICNTANTQQRWLFSN